MLQGPKGFRAAGVAAGFKKQGLDLAMIVADAPMHCVIRTTDNQVKALPIQRSERQRAAKADARVIVVNTRSANVCSGSQGQKALDVSVATAAKLAGVPEDQVWTASTGVIGVPPNPKKFETGLPDCFGKLRTDGWEDFSQAICTTDAFPKTAIEKVGANGTLLGIAKGAGMIDPAMATMLGFVVTDVPATREQADEILGRAIDKSFNAVSVDGDRSTNDIVMFVTPKGEANAETLEQLGDALERALTKLALDMVRDGEGAKHIIEVHVTGARTPQEARRAARAIGGSQLVKTAVYGRDPNWGRIAATAGAAGVTLDPNGIEIHLCGTLCYRAAEPQPFDREAVVARMAELTVRIDVALGVGFAEAVHYASDLGYEYIKINADYTT